MLWNTMVYPPVFLISSAWLKTQSSPQIVFVATVSHYSESLRLFVANGQ